jgi:hypothetical protein
MGKRPRTAPMVRCQDIAGILNKFAEPIFWCQPERSFRKNRKDKNDFPPPIGQQCADGFDPDVEYVWMPYPFPDGTVLHLSYVDCDYVD